MCGISFIIDKKGILDDNPIKKMVLAQGHRGPDVHHNLKQTFPDDSQIFLGASRLRISENTPNADQPFFSPDQSSAILFNGEIYNYTELKNELLKREISFTTNSDTEVLLQWIKTFGTTRISELEGMFAFVYCDFNEGKVIIARDRFGMKPLYYFENELFIVFSSETRGIIESGLIKKEINEGQIPYYFNYKYAQPPGTFYKNINQLPRGCIIQYDHNTLGDPKPFYSPAA